jgi:hypothetical protein
VPGWPDLSLCLSLSTSCSCSKRQAAELTQQILVALTVCGKTEMTPGQISRLDETQPNPKVLVGDQRFSPPCPLNDTDGMTTSQELIQAQPPGLLRIRDTVQVNVKKLLLVLGPRVLTDQHEGGAYQRLSRAPTATNALGQARLARTQRSLQTDHVPSLQQRTQASTQALRLLSATTYELKHMLFKQDHDVIGLCCILEAIIQPMSIGDKQNLEADVSETLRDM